MITKGFWQINRHPSGLPFIEQIEPSATGYRWRIASLHTLPDKEEMEDNARALVKVPEMIDALVNARSMLSAFRDNSGTVDQIDRILNDIGQGMI